MSSRLKEIVIIVGMVVGAFVVFLGVMTAISLS
ncbi:hypothetical protein BH18THE2_BH18THE2_17040 [soil metagenome]